MKDQPQTDTESVSPEVEALARELYRVGIIVMKGGYSSGPWVDMEPRQKQGWFAIAKHVIDNFT